MNAAAILGALHAGRKMLTLLAVLAVAASIYVWLQAAKADRAQLLAQAREICTAAGVPFQPDGAKQADWGKACQGRVTYLASFRAQTVEGSLTDALAAMEARDGKQATDAALAAAMSKRTATAVENMEAANAAVQGDVVGPGWACAVNELAGLRAPGC